jgi:hypothetical protein
MLHPSAAPSDTYTLSEPLGEGSFPLQRLLSAAYSASPANGTSCVPLGIAVVPPTLWRTLRLRASLEPVRNRQRARQRARRARLRAGIKHARLGGRSAVWARYRAMGPLLVPTRGPRVN